jgi:hypothetical protein
MSSLRRDARNVLAWALPRVNSNDKQELDIIVALQQLVSKLSLESEEAWQLQEMEGFRFQEPVVKAAFEAGFRLARGQRAGEDEDP